VFFPPLPVRSLWDSPSPPWLYYTLLRKRTNLLLDEELLEEVPRVSGEKSPSRAVTRALEEYLRQNRARRILDLAGSGLREGDLSEMRGDAPGPAPSRKEPRAPR
jgi:Arc/MetJ family transcription regulator